MVRPPFHSQSTQEALNLLLRPILLCPPPFSSTREGLWGTRSPSFYPCLTQAGAHHRYIGFARQMSALNCYPLKGVEAEGVDGSARDLLWSVT